MICIFSWGGGGLNIRVKLILPEIIPRTNNCYRQYISLKLLSNEYHSSLLEYDVGSKIKNSQLRTAEVAWKKQKIECL